MKHTKAIKVASFAMLLFVVTPSFADSATNQLPTIAEIDAEITSLANKYGAKTLWREFIPTVGRIKDLQDKFPTQEVLQVQWHVVSNMFAECYPVAAVTNGNQVNYQGLEHAVWLHLTKYRLFHADTNALMFLNAYEGYGVQHDILFIAKPGEYKKAEQELTNLYQKSGKYTMIEAPIENLYESVFSDLCMIELMIQIMFIMAIVALLCIVLTLFLLSRWILEADRRKSLSERHTELVWNRLCGSLVNSTSGSSSSAASSVSSSA